MSRFTPRRIVRGAAHRTRHVIRDVVAARRPIDRLWERDLREEVEFWADYLRTRGGRWPEEYRLRLNPDAPLGEHLIADRLERFGPDVSILDVGAGPLTTLGRRHPGKRIDVTAVDPLAAEYSRLLDELGIAPPVRTVACAGEQLLETFGEESFDVAYARNSLDHTAHPWTILEQMLALVRSGGFVALRHYRNEGWHTDYGQLHNWNFDIVDGDARLWGRHGRYELSSLGARVTSWFEYTSDKTPWVAVILER